MSDRKRSIFGALLPAACLLFVMLAGLGLDSYGQYVLAIGFISTTIGVALVLLVGFARVITLTSGAMMALGAYGSTLLVIHLGLPYWASVIGAVLIGGLSGWILAIPGVRFRSHNLAMVTLVFQAVVMILIREARRYTGGAEGITVPPADWFGLPIKTDADYVVMIGLGAVLATLLMAIILRGRFGKNMRAVAANETGAEAFGIDIPRYFTAAFIISSAVIGLAGALAAPRIRIIDPDSFGVLASVFMLAYPIIGGMTSIWGGIMGGAALRLLPEVLRPVADYQELIFAALVIAVTMFMPGGLAELIHRAYTRLRRKAARKADPASVPVATPVEPAVPVALAHGLAPALRVQAVSKRFDALQAVDNVSFVVPSGTIHGIIGPNGAGKTSLFNIVSGFLTADQGEIELFGEKLLGLPTRRRIGLGMSRTFQHVALFRDLSCLDNVIIGLGRNGVLQAIGQSFDDLIGGNESRAARARAQTALDAVGLGAMSNAAAGSLPLGNQRRLEIARAIACEPRLMLLDEPVSGLSQQEAAELRELLLRINRERGVAMLVIEHNIGFVTDLCATVSVMGSGQIIAEGPARTVIALPAVRQLYFGERAAA
ncbi:MAG: ATP-binding cassette domain-containing protein [Alphaproteobacteria bacterium]